VFFLKKRTGFWFFYNKIIILWSISVFPATIKMKPVIQIRAFNSYFLVMTMVHNVSNSEKNIIRRNRKSSKKIFTNAIIILAVFGKIFRKWLYIPWIIDDYNHYINKMDCKNWTLDDRLLGREVLQWMKSFVGTGSLWKLVWNNDRLTSWLIDWSSNYWG
jgi:hypothetical protein